MNDNAGEFSPLPQARPWYAPWRDNPRHVVTESELRDSFLTQWYRLTVAGVHLALRPPTTPHQELWPEPVVVVPEFEPLWGAYVLTFWHRPGEVSSREVRLSQEKLLGSELARWELDTLDLGVFGQTSQWVEPAVLVQGSEEEVVDLARHLGQLAVVRLLPGVARVIGVEDQGLAMEFPLGAHVLPTPPCPMSLGVEVTLPVKREGGPWVSRSMEVAAMWQTHFAITHRLAPCAVHSGNRIAITEPGSAIALAEVVPSSRFAQMAFI